MFTGIIETRAEVRRVDQTPDEASRLILHAPKLVPEMAIGESLAVNGCCLTVAAIESSESELAFDLLRQTRRLTNLGDLAPGAQVNLERALLPTTRLSGHFVQGHIDETLRILARESAGDDTRFDFELSEAARSLLIPRGSVALDGISLTVADLQRDRFSVWIIPHTLEVTNLGERRVGDRVNVEYDMFGKYIRRHFELAESG